jgi:hypothetical protein
MYRVVLIGFWLFAGYGQEPAAIPDVTTWTTYVNPTYKYSIQYPEGFDLWPTGPVDDRDGRSIRIGRSEYAAPTPVMDLRLRSETTCAESLINIESRDMETAVVDVDINGTPAREATHRWRENGEIVFVDLCIRDAMVQFHAAPGLADFHDTVWWSIIETLDLSNDDE